MQGCLQKHSTQLTVHQVAPLALSGDPVHGLQRGSCRLTAFQICTIMPTPSDIFPLCNLGRTHMIDWLASGPGETETSLLEDGEARIKEDAV